MRRASFAFNCRKIASKPVFDVTNPARVCDILAGRSVSAKTPQAATPTNSTSA
jgi:hypothetical protein